MFDKLPEHWEAYIKTRTQTAHHPAIRTGDYQETCLIVIFDEVAIPQLIE